MARYFALIFVVCALLYSTADAYSLLDAAANVYQGTIGAVIPEATKEACRGLGWRDPKDKRSVVDAFIPSFVSKAVGAGHAAVFPESMQESFCTAAGMVKGLQRPQQQQVIYQQPAPIYQYDPPTYVDQYGNPVAPPGK